MKSGNLWPGATTPIRRLAYSHHRSGPPLTSFVPPANSALGLPARLLLAPHELPVALAEVEATEEILLHLEDRRPALLRVVAVHRAARARSAAKLGEEDRGGKHATVASSLEPISA